MRINGTSLDSKCPCRECTAETGRCVGCHAGCKRYLGWKDDREAEKERIKGIFMAEKSRDDDKLYRIMNMRKLSKQRHLARKW